MIDWKIIIEEKIKGNLLECEEKLETKEYLAKIEKWCGKFNFDFNTALEKAKKDQLFRAFFAKDPKKQNIYENSLVKYISSLEFVSKFRKLSSGGKNALYIDRGVIRKKSEYCDEKPPSKSVDFYWEIKNNKGEIINFYAYHKYIEESGGAQDNQFNEIKKCIDIGKNGSQKVNRRVIFVCDGAYFTEEKIRSLKNLNINCVILKSNELLDYLSKLL